MKERLDREIGELKELEREGSEKEERKAGKGEMEMERGSKRKTN